MFTGTYFYYKKQFLSAEVEKKWKPELELYEVFRIIDGRPLFLNEHMARLKEFFREKDLKLPYVDEELRAIIFSLIHKNNLRNGNIRISFDLSTPELEMVVGEIPSSYLDRKYYKEGVSSVILNEERISPNIKIFQKELRRKAQDLMIKSGSFDVILCNKCGDLTEGSRTNVFFLSGNELFTSPVKQVLPGITRQKVLELCKKEDILVHIERIPKKDAIKMDAAFFTGTSPGILPISNIGDQKFDVLHPLLLKINMLYKGEVVRNLSMMSQKMSKKQKRC